MKTLRSMVAGLAAASLAAFAIACSDDASEPEPGVTSAPQLSGSILIDGSSTVFPITEAVAEEFREEQRNVRVTVGIAGTGGGFQKFCNGEIAIQDASRPINATEREACAAKGIEYIELPVAYDALSVVVNPQNTWATCITIAELKKAWEPAAQGNVTNWNQVKSDYPNADLKLFGPGTDSGTFDYFTERVNGKAKDSRGDFTASEDDNVLVQGVAGDRNALGYFGLAYYLENASRLKALTIDSGNGTCVAPSAATVENGTYPLSRPLLIYVRKAEAQKPEVKAFVDFYIENAAALSADVGYVKFPDQVYGLVQQRWTAQKAGSMYLNASSTTPIGQLLAQP
ncbi:MAG: phosphate ABC transporter substrate-binding protein PstS family protein [Dehalococcoidia bacterium]|nr:phosphate ABC transporter substrate-binding protein PstS family protein [Dehalococcoidia bacterium]